MTVPEPPPVLRVESARERRAIGWWCALGGIGFVLLPWYALQGSILSLAWVLEPFARDTASALLQAFVYGRLWLQPVGALLVAAGIAATTWVDRRARSTILLAAGGSGVLYTLLQGFAIGPRGLRWALADSVPGTLVGGQPGL